MKNSKSLKDTAIWAFIDGSSLGNPGPGGWGAVLSYPNDIINELGGFAPATTNNRMEMQAAISALRCFYKEKGPAELQLISDSLYLIEGATGRLARWKSNGWKTSTGTAVANQDLWEELDEELARSARSVSWVHVRGHVGTPGNERADFIATEFAAKREPLLAKHAKPEASLSRETLRDLSHQKTLPPSKKKSGRTGTPLCYVSYLDGQFLTHETWAECEKRVKGKAGAKFKKVFDAAELTELKRQWTR